MTVDNQVASQTQPMFVKKRKVHVETWGCQMNVADSERMLALLQTKNYELTKAGPESADLILLNTCHIREKARHKVLSRLGVLDELKQKNPNLKIAVTGCVAQADGKKLLELAPQIDVVLGPGKIDDLPRLLEESTRQGVQVISTGFESRVLATEEDASKRLPKDAISIPTVTGKKEVTRFVNIIQGCNNFCTFCVVPFTRGREISRSIDEIRAEVEYLVRQGSREITLLGQNVNSYGLDFLSSDEVPADGGPFVELLKTISSVEDLERLRFTTSNPHDFTKPLADLFAAQPKLGRYMHLPVQAGNNRTLERMKRKVTVEQYLERIEWLRQAVPQMSISTDIIVGFPGETEDEFEDTLNLLEKVRFSFVYAFKYSPRRGTAAARFSDQIAEAVKDARLARLNSLQDKISLELAIGDVGSTKEVLFIYESQKAPGIWVGKTPEFRTVRVKSTENLLGQTRPVYISGGNKIALLGDLVH